MGLKGCNAPGNTLFAPPMPVVGRVGDYIYLCIILTCVNAKTAYFFELTDQQSFLMIWKHSRLHANNILHRVHFNLFSLLSLY